MAKIFITGSTDGLGLLAARQLLKQGHEVVLHARNEQRGKQALNEAPGAKHLLTGDLSDLGQTRELAEKANQLGKFHAVIHNAGVYQVNAQQLLAVNTLAPYLLTALMDRPKRLIYLSSGMHLSGHAQWTDHPSYSDTKLHVLMLARLLARQWPDVYANAVDPGWVPTKMGGKSAPDDLDKGYETQVWLATSEDAAAKVSGQYFHHQRQAHYNMAADDSDALMQLIKHCEQLTGVKL